MKTVYADDYYGNIEASKRGRKAIGTDINLLAYKLCKASLTRWNLSKVEEAIDTFCAEVSFACESLSARLG